MNGRHEGVQAPDRADASMSLLNEVVRSPLEPEYAQAAARGDRSTTRGSRSVWVILAVLLGVLTSAAVLSLRTPQPAALEARQLLEQEIAQRSADSDVLDDQNEQLSAEIVDLQNQALAGQDPALLARLDGDELLSGAAPVTGPGLLITLHDGPPPADDNEPEALSRVQDLDLQSLVNGLWAAGAEAIAINGHRLTAVSAVRGAGDAILVDLSPVLSPYEVQAIGDAQAMQTELARLSAGRRLALLASTYGIVAEMSARDHLALPGATTARLQFAGPAQPGGPPDPGRSGGSDPTGPLRVPADVASSAPRPGTAGLAAAPGPHDEGAPR